MNSNIKHILFVEGESDEKFFKTLLQYSQKKEDINTSVQAINFSKIGGSDEKKLIATFKSIRTDLRNGNINSVGVIIDIDNYSLEQRIEQINNAANQAFNDYQFTNFSATINSVQLKPNNIVSIPFSFQIIKDVTGQGNLETLLQNIVTQNPIAASCLEDWKNCAAAKGVKIKQSDFAKFWKEVYVRYDYCSNKELAKHAAENCTFEKSLENMLIEAKPKAWNFEHDTLKDLRNYLNQF